MQYTADNLIVRPNPSGDIAIDITPKSAGWDHIHFQVRRLQKGASWSFSTGENELALINITGEYHIHTDRGEWHIGGRKNVFESAAHALVLPRRTAFTIRAEQGGEFAVTWAATDRDIAPLHITPDRVSIELRGGDNVTRQINNLLPPGAPVHRLVLVEVYTPSGNWSSYPPHKHDVHIVRADGTLIESDLEEVYYFKIDKPHGFAFQRIYTDERSPLHQAGQPIDAVVMATDGSAVLVPEGYHPVVSAPGYTTYYLNVLAGSAQSLANQDDPNHTWVKHNYAGADPRLPLY